jgi:hypothetical protein
MPVTTTMDETPLMADRDGIRIQILYVFKYIWCRSVSEIDEFYRLDTA